MAFASLTIDLNARLANIERDMGKMAHVAEKQSQRMQASFARAGQALAAIGSALSIGAFAGFIKTSIDAADAMSKLSTKTGIAVEDLAGWQHVMDLSGASTEQFEMAVGKLNTTIAKNPEKLEKLGIMARDSNGVLLELADAFQRIEDPTRRAAIASEIFGERVGRDMVVALSQGRQGVEELIRQGKELTPVTAEMARQAELFNDTLDTMKKRAGSVGVQVANTLLPSMNEVLQRWNQAIILSRQNGGFFDLIFKGINPTGEAGREIESLRDKIRNLQKQRENSLSFNKGADVSAIDAEIAKLQALKKTLVELEAVAQAEKWKDYARYKQPALPSPKGLDTSGYFDTGGKGKTGRSPGAVKQISDLQWATEESAHLQKTWAQIYEQIDADAAAAFETAVASAEEWEAGTERANDALQAMRQGVLAVIDPIQQYRDKLEEVDTLVEKGLLTQDQATEARLYWQEQIDGAAGFGQEVKKTKSITEELGLTFASAFEDAAIQGGKLRDVIQGMAQDLYRVFLRKTVTEPLGNWASELFKGVLSADGNAFVNAPALSAYSGSVVSRPTVFPFAGGGVFPRVGVMGEAGPEAILPLKRGAGGKLGVSVDGSMGGAVIINQSFDFRDADAGTERRLRAQAERIKRETLATLMDNLNRGGQFALATGRRG